MLGQLAPCWEIDRVSGLLGAVRGQRLVTASYSILFPEVYVVSSFCSPRFMRLQVYAASNVCGLRFMQSKIYAP